MKWAKEVLQWLKDYWGLLLLFGGTLIAFLYMTRKDAEKLFSEAVKEQEIIEAKAKVRREEIRKGVEAAKKMAQDQYLAKIKEIDKTEHSRYMELINDPEALVDAVLRRTYSQSGRGSEQA